MVAHMKMARAKKKESITIFKKTSRASLIAQWGYGFDNVVHIRERKGSVETKGK